MFGEVCVFRELGKRPHVRAGTVCLEGRGAFLRGLVPPRLSNTRCSKKKHIQKNLSLTRACL